MDKKYTLNTVRAQWKKFLTGLCIAMVALLIPISQTYSQCTNGSSYGSATAPTSGTTTISTCSYAGEYSTISSVVAGSRYKLTSSVATDYITVHSGSASGPVVAAGITPLTFLAPTSGTYYSHWTTNITCGTQSTCRTTTISANGSGCTNSSSYGSATAPASGVTVNFSTCSYGGEYSTLNSAVAGQMYQVSSSVITDFITVHSGSSSGPIVAAGVRAVIFVAPTSGTYYVAWSTNSACGTQSSCRTTSVKNLSPPPPSGCTNTSSYGSATIGAPGAVVTISTCSYAGEYSTISGAVSGMGLTFTSSVATDYITIHTGSSSGPIIGFGQTPLTISNTFTGTLYAHWSTNNTCGTQSTCRTTTVQQLQPSCTNSSSYGSATIGAQGTSVTISTCSYAGEYSTISGAANGQTLIFTSSVGTDYISVHSGSSNGPVIAAGLTPLQFANGYTGTIYAHWNTNSSCGTQSTCRTTTVTNVAPTCTNTSSYGSATIPANNSITTISSCSYAGEYSTISGAISGQTLRFEFSNLGTGAYVTIHSGSSNGPVIAAGSSPLTFSNTYTGTLYAHWSLNSSCATDISCHTTTVQCTSCYAPPPANDNCSGALPLVCGTITGNNTDATADAITACTSSSGNNYNGVWYVYNTSSPGGATVTVSTYGGATWDTYLRVYSGSCGALNCVTSNDDYNLTLQSQVTFTASAGVNYYILLTGYSSIAYGTYTLDVSCVVCSAPPIAGIANGPTSGCTNSNLVYSNTGGSGAIQWAVALNPGGPYTDITGATTATVNLTASASGTYYLVCKRSNPGCGEVITNEIPITINQGPGAISAVSSAPGACPGSSISLESVLPAPSANLFTFSTTTGVPLEDMTGAVQLIGSGQDDYSSSIAPIGFTFGFDGQSYTQFSVSSNGLIGLGSTVVPTTFSNATDNSPFPKIMTIWDDLHTGNNGYVSYKNVGTGNNQKLVIEFKLRLYSGDPVTDATKIYQAWLFANNTIQFVYGADAGNGLSSASVGISTAAGIFNDINTSTHSNSTSVVQDLNTAWPGSGRSYTFTPPQTSGLSITWSGPNGFTYSGQTPPAISNFQAANAGTYTVLLTGANGCTSTGTVAVSAYPVPSVATLPINAACEGSAMTVSASDYSANPATSFAWSGPNGFNGTTTVNGGMVNITAQGVIGIHNGTYQVNGTNSYGCHSIASTLWILNPNPVPYVVTGSLDSVSCPGYNDGGFIAGVNSGTSFPIGVQANPFNIEATGTANGTIVSNTGVFSNLYQETTPGMVVTVGDYNSCIGTTHVIVPLKINRPPVWISTPSNITAFNDLGDCGATINWTTPTWSDDCPGTTMLQTAGFANGAKFPIGTTTVSYTVTDAQGLTISHSFTVTVTDHEAPSVSNCPVNFDACNPVTWTPPSFSDNCPGMVVVSSHTPGTNFAPGNTTVTYTATDVYGNATSCSFQVHRLTESVAADTITSNRTFHNICIGENITMNVSGGSLGDGGVWKWYTGSCGTTLVGTGPSLTTTPLVTTTYYVRAEGSCNITACTPITVVVSTSGPGNISVVSAPSVGAPGQSGVLTVTTPFGATYYQYSSNLGHISAVLFNGQIGPYLTPSNSVNVSFQLPLQNYQIRVLALNACGRSNTASTTIRGTVGAGTSITSGTGNLVACPNQNITYTGAPISGSNQYTWTITPATAGTITSGQGGLVVNVHWNASFSGSATLCYHGQTTFNLAGPDFCVTISTSAPTPGAIAGLTAPCQGSTGTYSIAAVTGATGYNWSTTVPGASIIGSSTSVSVHFPSNSFSGSVCVSAITACGMSTPSCMSVVSGTPGIPGPISGPQNGVCEVNGISYFLSTSNANNYIWTTSSPYIVVANGNGTNSVLVNFLPGFTSGTISVEAVYSCGSTIETINVDGKPGVPSVSPADLCIGGQSVYFASSVGASSFTWVPSGQIYGTELCLNGSCSQFYIEWDWYFAYMEVMAENSCGTSDPFNSWNYCRIGNTMSETEVYPNPTDGKATVSFSARTETVYTLTVTDLAGRTLKSQTVNALRGLNEIEIDLSQSGKGVYLVNLKDSEGNSVVKRVCVQ